MKELMVWLSVQLLIKVASSEWMLAVQIQQFENLFNAEKIGDYYCCCDDNPCDKNISVLTQCVASCDTYFIVYFPACSYNETCPDVMYTKIIDNSPSIIRWRPYLQLLLDQSDLDNQSVIIVEAWDYHSGYSNHIIDSFIIPVAWKALKFAHSVSLIIEGEFGIGKLTLSFYNITDADTSSCTSHTQKVTCTTTADNNMKSIVPATVTVSEISPTVTVSAEIVISSLMWKTLALLFLVVAISSIIVNIALCIFAYCTRKDVKSTSRITAHEEIQPPDAETHNIYQHVDNALYQETNAPDSDYFKSGPTDKQEGNIYVYDLACTTEEELASLK